MSWLDNIKGSFKPNQDNLKKSVLLKLCTLKEVEKIYKQYVNKKPVFSYENDDGIMIKRYPKRDEFEQGIIAKVPIDSMIQIIPKLKKKAKEWEYNENEQ